MEGYEKLVKAYLDWPRQARESYAKGVALSLPSAYTAVEALVVCGMGGSGVVGDYLRTLAARYGGVPVYVVKSYRLPAWTARVRALVITVSYSGNTVETLECYANARAWGLPRLVVTSGGALQQRAREDGVPVIPVEKTAAARAALASMLYGLVGALKVAGLLEIPQSEVEKSIEELEGVVSAKDGEAAELAQKLQNTIPVFVCHADYEPLCWRFKNEFNENAKVQCKVEVAPEWGHNDIEGWHSPVHPEHHHAVILDPVEAPASDLIRLVKEILETRIPTTVLELKGRNMLSKMIVGSLVAGISSAELAKMRGIDPLKTELIKMYRERLGRLQLRG